MKQKYNLLLDKRILFLSSWIIWILSKLIILRILLLNHPYSKDSRRCRGISNHQLKSNHCSCNRLKRTSLMHLMIWSSKIIFGSWIAHRRISAILLLRRWSYVLQAMIRWLKYLTMFAHYLMCLGLSWNKYSNRKFWCRIHRRV